MNYKFIKLKMTPERERLLNDMIYDYDDLFYFDDEKSKEGAPYWVVIQMLKQQIDLKKEYILLSYQELYILVGCLEQYSDRIAEERAEEGLPHVQGSDESKIDKIFDCLNKMYNASRIIYFEKLNDDKQIIELKEINKKKSLLDNKIINNNENKSAKLNLTKRELEYYRLLLEYKNVQKIAEMKKVGINTVKDVLLDIYKKGIDLNITLQQPQYKKDILNIYTNINWNGKLKSIKEKLPEDCTYDTIRAVIAIYDKENKKAINM